MTIPVTCGTCGRSYQVDPKDNALAADAYLCQHCYDFAVAIALMEPKDREYLYRYTRPKMPLPPGFWWMVVAGALIWGWTFWRFLK